MLSLSSKKHTLLFILSRTENNSYDQRAALILSGLGLNGIFL